MAFMKFYEGSEANAQSYLDGIYLATDTHKLFYKGSPYGGDPYTELDWIQDFKSGSGTMEEAAFNKLKDAVDNYKLLVVSCSGAAHSTRVCTPEIGDDGSYICKFTDINNYDNADTYILAVKIASVNPSTRAITMLHDTTYPLGGKEVDLSRYVKFNNNLGDLPNISYNEGLSFGKNSSDFIEFYLSQDSHEAYYWPNGLMFVDGDYNLQLSCDGNSYICIRNSNISSINIYDYEIDLYDYTQSNYAILKLSKDGVTIQNKSNTDLLHAAGGTISIEELKSQLNIPDTTSLQSAIGTNTYTGANYISKETNLTEAVLQLDEEIKATNDNLSLEHENAEATYAKKTDLNDYLPLTGGTLTGAMYVQGDKYTYPNFGISASGIAYYEKQGFARLFSIGYNSEGEVKHGIFGLSNDTTPLNEGDDLTITPDGVTLKDKTNQDLLHAAGGTVSIQDIIAQANVPTNVSQLTNDAGYQTETQVSAKVSALVDSAPETLNTLNELAAALGDDPNFATTISTELGKKLDTNTYNADKATFALKSEIPDVSNFLTLSNAQSTYLTKTDASNTYQPKGSYLTSIPSEYVTESELNSKGYLTKATADSTYQAKGNYLTSVSWDQVGSKPSWIGSSKPSYTWSEIGSKPSFATVATSGSYNDLTNKPSIPSIEILTTTEVQSILNS